MKHLGFIIGIAGAVITGDASAQSVSLTGTYQCVHCAAAKCWPMSRRTGPN